MHIVQLANFYGPRSGGLRTAIDRLADGYCDRGHRVTTIVPGEHDDERREGERTIVAIRSPLAPFLGGGYRVIVDVRAVGRALDRAGPDVIELSDKTTLVGPAERWRERGVPVVAFSHERLDEIVERASRLRASRRVVDRYNRRWVDRVDAVVCALRYSAAELQPHVERIELVPLGVDLDRFRPRPLSARTCPKIVVAVRLSPEKGPTLLLDTSRALLDAGREHEMIVYGDGPLRQRLARRATDLPIRFAGFLTDRSRLAVEMATADVGIAPGPLETFGLAALELLASGTPVVVPDRGALAEIADGTSAVAAERTGDRFARAVVDVLDIDHDRRRAAARTLAERYEWDRSVTGMLDVFDRVVGPADARCPADQRRSYL